MDTFDIRKFLVENKLTENSRGTVDRVRFLKEGLVAEPKGEMNLKESGDRQPIDPKTGKEVKEGYDHHDPDYDEGWIEERPGEDPFEMTNGIDEVSYTGYEDDVNFQDPDDLDDFPEDDMPADDYKPTRKDKAEFEDDDDDLGEPEPEAGDDESPEMLEFENSIEDKYPGEIEWIDTERLHNLLKGRKDAIDPVRANRFWEKAIKACWNYFKEYDYPKVLAVDFSYRKGEEGDDEENSGYIFKRILPHPLCKVYRPEGCYPEYDDDGNLINK